MAENSDLVSNVDAILATLTALHEDVGELKSSLNAHNNREFEFQREYEREHGKVVSKADAAHRRLDDLEKVIDSNTKTIKALSESIKPLLFANKLMSFVAAGFGLSVIGLIWAIIIGQVHLVLP